MAASGCAQASSPPSAAPNRGASAYAQTRARFVSCGSGNERRVRCIPGCYAPQVSDAESQPAADGPSPKRDADPDLVRLAAGFYGVVLLFAVGYALFSGNHEIKKILGTQMPTIPALLAGIGVGLVIVCVVRIGAEVLPAVDNAATALAELLGPVSRKDALLLALFSAVAEEVLFRGALWHHLGLAGTTCLFGLVHIVPRRKLWAYPLFAAAAGLILGLLRQGTGSVLPPILVHFVVNALNLVWIGARASKSPASAGDAA